MAASRTYKATPSNAGLLALTRAHAEGLGLDDATESHATALLVVTDGIAITFQDELTPAATETVRASIVEKLGTDWELREESLSVEGQPYSGVTALPPPDGVPPVSEAWELARELARINGVHSAVPLFAHFAPLPENPATPILGFDNDDEGPSDPVQARVWHHQSLKIAQAWTISRQNGHEPGVNVVVGVIDTGYTDHPEVFGQLTKVNGQPNKVRGIDLIDNQDPRDPLEGSFPTANPGHGTLVASVIASPEGAPANWPADKAWLDGIAPAAHVMPVRVTASVVLLLPNKLTPAIRQATDQGVDVINMSLGLPTYWSALHASVQYAISKGVIVVAASGNYWPTVVYPARFPEVLAAANCGFTSREWRWASAGSDVDVIAPGVAVQSGASDRNQNNSVSFDVRPATGTTFAAACCSGLAALWLAHHGGRQQLIAHYQGDARRVPQAFHFLIRKTAKTLPGVPAGRYGTGLPQADALLQHALPSVATLEQEFGPLNLLLAAAPAIAAAPPPVVARPRFAAAAVARQDELDENIARLLGGDALAPFAPELVAEVSFHFAMRPELWRLPLTANVDEVRALLLRSNSLSPTLRSQLQMADAALVDLTAQTFPARLPKNPTQRSLQVYAIDPSLTSSLRTANYNVVTVKLPWEKLEAGPVGDYVEVVDVDPASGAAYEPVDLDDYRLLPSQGIAPDESDPWFHQQMVFAVAMKTIYHFEVALGRPAMWAVGMPKIGSDDKSRESELFYERLRIYPHALRERNAYYSPEKRALLFGYFRSPGLDAESMGPMVFTCLSYDIIAHETTHALLDGIYRYFIEDTNPDMLAFHEAFADIVALFQHFTHAEVLRAAIEETRGDLETESTLGKLAQQFGEATGARGALRDAIGYVKDGKWVRRQPNPNLLARADHQTSPHLRGSILVAAVFDAFLKIYQRRAKPLVRLATGGTGVLPPGNLTADLAEGLAQEAAKTAGHILNLCIRALDYLPPVNITFGEYLRAVITADRDLVPNDQMGYRIAIVESFRAWGIQPQGVSSVAPESLCWNGPEGFAKTFELGRELVDFLNRLLPAWRVNRKRKELHKGTVIAKAMFNKALKALKQEEKDELGRAIGIDLGKRFEVHTLRPATTLGPDNAINPMVVVTILQRKRHKGQTIRTGSTILFSRGDGKISYIIHKRDSKNTRSAELKAHLQLRQSAAVASDPYQIHGHQGEPFASLHLTGFQ